MCIHNRKQQVKLLRDFSCTFKNAQNDCKEKGSQAHTAWGQFQFMPLLQAYRRIKPKSRQCTEALLWWEVSLIKLKPRYQPSRSVTCQGTMLMKMLLQHPVLSFPRQLWWHWSAKQLKCHMWRQMQPRAIMTGTNLSAIKSSEHFLRNKNLNNSTVKMPQCSAGSANSCPISSRLSPNCIL